MIRNAELDSLAVGIAFHSNVMQGCRWLLKSSFDQLKLWLNT